MRPIRLEVQGLTSFRQPVAVDFTDLDLFAITGPTGSGKSSLIDAITFALYGKVPRVNNRVKELISLGADRLKVMFYFNAGDTQYRIYRETARKGAGKPPQIERFDPESEEWRSEDPDRVRDINKFIEELLLLDYEAFIRSVLLPQGEFQQFLCGDRDERRKVLDRLLRLAVYGVMQQRANAIKASHEGEAATISERLTTELAAATPETLAAEQAALKQLETEAVTIVASRDGLEQAVLGVERMTAARDREARERAGATAAAKRLETAKAVLATGEQALAALDASLEEGRRQLAETGYDPDLRATLTEARGHAQQRDSVIRKVDETTSTLESAKKGVARITEETAVAKTRWQEVEGAIKAHAEILDGLRRANAAIDLRAGLKVGDACPVCGERITHLPQSAHTDIDRASADLEARRVEERAAREALAEIEQRGTRLGAQIESQQEQLASLAADLDEHRAALKELLGDHAITTTTLVARLNAQESARKEAARLGQEVEELTKQREGQAREMAAAQQDAATVGATVEAHERNAAAAGNEAASEAATVRALAEKQGWAHIVEALEDGAGASAIVKGDLERTRQEEARVNQAIGSGRNRIQQIESDIELAGRLRSEESAHREEAKLARDLATMLRTDGFPAFIRDSVMTTLADSGSAWLRKVSAGRYDLKVDGQDFEVADLWNAGEERGVRTLSGGETFLASLALALALAELLPRMSGEGDSGVLQSLFIDEGFSNLDENTLNDVAGALEVLGQDRRRLIGVVTHVPALAERMPARIIVHKEQTGSTVTVE